MVVPHVSFRLSEETGKRRIIPLEEDFPLRTAIKNCHKDHNAEALASVLKQCADVNQQFEYETSRKFTGTALTYAVKLKNNGSAIKCLIEAKADPNNNFYGFKAGLSQLDWRGVAAFGSTCSDNMVNLKLLVDYKAKLTGRLASLDHKPAFTLLYDACYNGREAATRFILEKTMPATLENPSDINCECQNQDDVTLYMAPLHVAARQGHCCIVRVLLEYKADIDLSGLSRMPPLFHAIDFNHPECLKLLLASRADFMKQSCKIEEESISACALYSVRLPSLDSDQAIEPASEPGPSQQSVIDYLFKNNNVVMIDAFALGLQGIPYKNIREVFTTSNYLVKFLGTPGFAAVHIFSLIFQSHMLQFVKGQNERRVAKVACLKNEFNVALGPHPDFFENQFKALLNGTVSFSSHPPREIKCESPTAVKRPCEKPSAKQTQDARRFIDELLCLCMQQVTNSDCAKKTVPVEILWCPLANIQDNDEVLFAIANASNWDVFDLPACQAILVLAWRKHQVTYNMQFVLSVLLALFFLIATLIINKPDLFQDSVRLMIVACMSLLIFCELAQETLSLCGHHRLGKMSHYFHDPWNVVDLVRIVTCTCSACSLGVHWYYRSFTEDVMRLILAFNVMFRWIKVLNCMRGFEKIGKDMLPILKALRDIVPFLLVIVCPLIGLFNAYYALGIHSGEQSFTMMYRLGLLGDFDIEELEDVDGTYTNDGGTLSWNDPERTSTWFPVRLLVLFGSFMLTITMMNIFIGVLGNSYNRHYERMEQVFWQDRASCTFDMFARREAWDWLCSSRARPSARQKSSSRVTPAVAAGAAGPSPTASPSAACMDSSSSSSMSPSSCRKESGYVWFCRRKTEAEGPNVAAIVDAAKKGVQRLERTQAELSEKVERLEVTVTERLKSTLTAQQKDAEEREARASRRLEDRMDLLLASIQSVVTASGRSHQILEHAMCRGRDRNHGGQSSPGRRQQRACPSDGVLT